MTSYVMRLMSALMLCFVTGQSVHAKTTAREEIREGERYLVLENDAARVVIWPEAGGAITEFTDKRTGHNFVTPGVRKGAALFGWKETTTLGDPETSSPADFLGTQIFQGQVRQGDGYAAAIVSCTFGHLSVQREMRLVDKSTALTIHVRHTNISDQPRMVWLRFHPFMTLDDNAKASAAILMPGPGPDVIRSVRRIPLESGYTDAHFLSVAGYWMIANPSSGAGIWMTFDPQDVMVNAVWTAKRNSTAEIYPHPSIVPPGKTVELRCLYQPFVAADRNEDLSRAFIPHDAQQQAGEFLKRVRPNLNVVATHTMLRPPGASGAAEQNLFHFSHRRRDRFALREWGIADAMMAVPGVQTISLRARLYANAFEGLSSPVSLTYELFITDALGVMVKQEQWRRTLSADQSPLIDERQDVSLADLPDGRYTFTLQVRQNDGSVIHLYQEQQKLVGHARQTAARSRIERELNVPLEERERPFVRALRLIDLPDTSSADLTLPIGVEEASGIARQAWPVRVGVPFAQGVLTPGRSIRLTSPGGESVPVQTHVMGTWPDGSVRWLLVDFQADVPANSHVFYQLRLGGEDHSPALPTLATTAGQTIRIDTGVARWSFNPSDNALLGLFEHGDIWWRTADGREYRFELRGEEAGLRVLENGPLRTVVQAVGWYYPIQGPANAAPIARGELRAEFYRGKVWHRLDHTFTFTGNPWQDALAGTGVRFSQLLRKAQAVQISRDGVSLQRTTAMTLWQPDEDHAITTADDGMSDAGRRASGAAAVMDDQQRVVVYHRHLWEMFPKQIIADPAKSQIAFEYWPLRAGVQEWLPDEDRWHSSSPPPQQVAVGVSRAHQYVVDASGAYQTHEYQQAFDEPVIAVVPPRYLCGTGVMMHLQPYDPTKLPLLENALSEAIDSYQAHREIHGWYGQWDYGTLHNVYEAGLQRWAVFGRYANILNEQNIAHLPWLAYLRSGDRRYLRFAELQTRHLMDVGSIRWNAAYPDSVGLSRRHHHCVWLSPADYGHSMLDPFVEMYHATGNLQAWEAAQRMAEAMAKQRSGQHRYLSNPIIGLTRMYLETQDPYYKQHADRLWNDLCAPDHNEWFAYDHGARMAIIYSQINPQCLEQWQAITDRFLAGYKNHSTTLGYIDALAMIYKQTGDTRYAQAARHQFEIAIADLQRNDPKREDPLRWSAAMPTQHILASLRQMVYASQALMSETPQQTSH